jgi:prolyl-tRNA synthetase
LDDRDERAGIKFKDAELLGFPIIVALGKSLAEGCAEVQVRRSGEKQQVRLDGILAFVAEKMKDV